MMNIIKQIASGLFLAFLAVATFFGILYAYAWMDSRPNYVKEHVDDVVYAEPTGEARICNVEKLVAALPQVNYTKSNYPIEEVYKYKFNGYEMAIDIPMGYIVTELPLKEEPRVIDAKDCSEISRLTNNQCAFNVRGFPNGSTVRSDNKLCVTKDEDAEKCLLGIIPEKSRFKGMSMKDIEIDSCDPSKSQASGLFSKDGSPFRVWEDSMEGQVMVSNDLSLTTYTLKKDVDTTDRSLYYNILESITITKQ